MTEEVMLKLAVIVMRGMCWGLLIGIGIIVLANLLDWLTGEEKHVRKSETGE